MTYMNYVVKKTQNNYFAFEVPIPNLPGVFLFSEKSENVGCAAFVIKTATYRTSNAK